MSKSVLVLGGSYFIGKKIVSTLYKNGYEVTTLNRGTKPNTNSNVNTIICNRDNPEQLEKALKDYLFDFVIDVSGLTAKHAETVFHALNKDKLQKYFFISSSAVYDINNFSAPFVENTPLAENKYWTDYGTNKIEAEQFLTKAFKNTNSSLVILRPPFVYGEDNYAQRESFFFDHIIKNQPILVPNNGQSKLQFIYTTDLANIIITLFDQSSPSVSIYNVGNKESVTIREWIQACAKVVGKDAIIVPFQYELYGYNVRDFFPFYDYDNVLDVNVIQYIYDTETDFNDGLSEAYRWFINNQESILWKENVANNEQKILSQLYQTLNKKD